MIKKIFINLIIFLFLFFLIDYIAYYSIFKIQYKVNNTPFSCMITKKRSNKAVELEKWKDYKFRPAVNTDINKKSIIFTGCSFVYGTGLSEEQTLPYKVSKILNRPVYNFGIESGGLGQLLTIIKNGVIFDKIHNNPDLIIYNYGDFHIQRIIMPNLMIENDEYLYKISNNKLVRKRPSQIVSRSYLLSCFREHIFEYLYENNKIFQNYIKKLLIMYFCEIKQGFEEKYGDITFIILVFFPSKFIEDISQELNKDGFKIIYLQKDLNIDINDEKYYLPDGHPNELAWNIVTPLLCEKIKEYTK